MKLKVRLSRSMKMRHLCIRPEINVIFVERASSQRALFVEGDAFRQLMTKHEVVCVDQVGDIYLDLTATQPQNARC